MSNSSCLWAKARENLPADVRDSLASLEQGIQPNATGTEQIDALIKQTAQKQQELGRTSHRFKKYFDNIIRWLDKFKGIGDVVSSFDPGHAALPWAAFRFILQAILAEREQADTVLELLASTPHFVFSGRVLEMVYTQESMHIGGTQNEVKLSQQGLDNLREELIKLYSALLSALKYCYFISSQHKVKRKATAIFNSSELVSIHQDLEAQHKKVIDRGEDCRKILSHTLSRKSLDLLRNIKPSLTEIGDRVRELLVRIDESERRETLKSISAILYRAHHEEVSGNRTAGTCEWILKKEKFIRWEKSDSSVTILYGNPGAGKTFLISRVVDYCTEKAEASEALAFFYCKRDEDNRRSPQDILRSILRQLSNPVKDVESGTIHVALKDLPNRLALNGTTFDVPTCENLIGKLIEGYSKTTIILDALDECDRNNREELMRVLSNLANGSSKFRVFISSRHDEDILRHFKGTPVMEMEATDNEEDISWYVEDRLFQDSRWAYLSPELQEEVGAVFHEKSLGMFQWAALQVDQIRRLRIWNEKSIMEQIKISPTGLKGAYDVVWNQMQEMSSYEKQLARRALQWVLCAFRPLETSELSLMMQINPNSVMSEADTVFTPETIQSICGNLLVYDLQSSVWRFSHLSAREYIEKHHYSILESHHHVAISSINFLERDLAWVPPSPESRMKHFLRVSAPKQSGPGGSWVEFQVAVPI
ncbi:related to vegetatible incompatibility protein HET-E-1 [Fusarium oxysporum]|uniref:Related to vegetatible incompatibility protein HET-E-1 n=1 Tax=Fusarium oxysporum TaxID=5507 RepID=A0A2H3TFB4_FUSOX|nr:related to vegetatible incompatibility protein HET-E-1 [Fusarium oxysporum]